MRAPGLLVIGSLIGGCLLLGAVKVGPGLAGKARGTTGVEIPVPTGFTHYCSTIGGLGPKRWSFVTGLDPCAGAVRFIRGAGLMSVSGTNTAIARCGPALSNLNHVITFKGRGLAPTDAAVREAGRTKLLYCEFKVAPDSLPIFTKLFSLDPLPKGMTWHHYVPDFSGHDGGVDDGALDVTSFGRQPQTGMSNVSTIVDYKGFDRREWTIDHHMAFDITLAKGTPLLALADGEVVMARSRRVDCDTTSHPGRYQGEVAIKHTVGSLESPYYEQFIVGYAHVQMGNRMVVEVGDLVKAGDVVAYSGNSGCTNGAYHLHYSVERTTNTARSWHFSYRAENPPNSRPLYAGHNGRAPIDPFGWRAPQNIDPQGYLYYNTPVRHRMTDGSTVKGGGAMSIDLWKPGHAHPRPCDENSRFWRRGSRIRVRNPMRNCD